MAALRALLWTSCMVVVASAAVARDDLNITLTADGGGISPVPVVMASASGLMVDWTNPDGTAEFRGVEDGVFAAWATVIISGDVELEVSVEREGRPAFVLGMFWQGALRPQVRVAFFWPALFESATGLGFVSVLGYAR